MSISREIALGLADGLLAQADRWLLVADGRAPRPYAYPAGNDAGSGAKPALVVGLEFLRSAEGYLEMAARLTSPD